MISLPGQQFSASKPVQSSTEPVEAVLTPLAEVSRRQGLNHIESRLLKLRAWLADDLHQLEQSLVDAEGVLGMAEGLPPSWSDLRVRSAAHHLLRLSGKRIRPLCVLVACRMGNKSMDATVRDVAVACELVHAATLLHDDVVDNSDERRGAPAARVLYGNSASVLGGDHLLVEALRLVHRAKCEPLLGELLRVMSRMVAAEALQLERRGRFEPDRTSYLEVIRGKTASLFGWGLWAGGVLAALDDHTCQSLRLIGEHLGMAFQLVDDVLDMEGDPAVTGKSALQDLHEGKLTWPLILAAEQDSALTATLHRLAQGPSDGKHESFVQEVGIVVDKIRASGALVATRQYALSEAAKACALLDKFPPGPARDALALVIQSAVYRLS